MKYKTHGKQCKNCFNFTYYYHYYYSASKCWFDKIICQVFYMSLRQIKSGMPHYLGGKILADNYDFTDSSVFTYIESTLCNMWAVLVSTNICISCDG